MKTLCFWCGFDSPDVKRKAGIEMDVDQSFIKLKLVKTLESIETNRSFDLSKVSLDTTFSRLSLKFLSTSSVWKFKNTDVIVTIIMHSLYDTLITRCYINIQLSLCVILITYGSFVSAWWCIKSEICTLIHKGWTLIWASKFINSLEYLLLWSQGQKQVEGWLLLLSVCRMTHPQ